jgi:chaperone required for assembly of F1-ATPase
MAAKKRFYKSVLLADDGLSIQLDGRNLRSPAGSLLRLPTMSLASAIADEWRAQAMILIRLHCRYSAFR